ncbi:MAG: ADP-heptose--LPS heptosyltransferase [Candidatus Binatia bacterium]|nr:MAG: ADP-heptose--LPS heptosyltransferase [Candidatus Binatia bacterium]
MRVPNWLGDLVLSLPALRAIRRAWPRAHLAVLVREELASFFEGSRWIDSRLAYRIRPGSAGWRDRWAVVRRLARERFDLAVLFTDSFESALWAFAAGIPERVGFAADARRLLLTHAVRRTAGLRRSHRVEEPLFLLEKALGIVGNRADGAPDLSSEARARVERKLSALGWREGRFLLCLAPGAAYGPSKRWPADGFASVGRRFAERRGALCLVLGSPSDTEVCRFVAEGSGGVSLAGETTVADLLAVLSLADLFVGNDSGAAHVAAALGTPTLTLFGSTDPRRTAPLGPSARFLWEPPPCSPCLARTCRYGHYECLRALSPREVVEAAEELLAGGEPRQRATAQGVRLQSPSCSG